MKSAVLIAVGLLFLATLKAVLVSEVNYSNQSLQPQKKYQNEPSNQDIHKQLPELPTERPVDTKASVKVSANSKRIYSSTGSKIALHEKWGTRKYEITKESKIEDILKMYKKGYDIDPNQLRRWMGEDSERMMALFTNQGLFILLLKAKEFNPSTHDNIAIAWASMNGQLRVVELLLKDARVDPSANDNAAIGFAAGNGFLEIVNLLLQHPRFKPSANFNGAVIAASEQGHANVVERLLRDQRLRLKPNEIEMLQTTWGNNQSIMEFVSQKKYWNMVSGGTWQK